MDMSTQENKFVVNSCHGHEHAEEQGRGVQLSRT